MLPHPTPPLTAAAFSYAQRGWAVFPVQPRGKKPTIGDWPNRALTDPATVAALWPTGHNVGIACGPSRLVVIDLDVGKPLPAPWDSRAGVHDGRDVFALLVERHTGRAGWPNTYIVATPSGGWHLYYAAAGDHVIRNSASQLGPLIDVRAEGGYVVAAGSTIHEGAYTVLNPVDPLPLPAWLAALAAKPRPKATPAPLPAPSVDADMSDRYVRAAFEREVQAVATAWAGARNNQLNKSAFALARFVAAGRLNDDVVTDALTAAGRHVGLSDHEIRATLRSALSARGVAA